MISSDSELFIFLSSCPGDTELKIDHVYILGIACITLVFFYYSAKLTATTLPW